MPKARPPYSPEFRRRMVELIRAGRDPADLACEFEPSPLGDPAAKQRPAELAEGSQAIRNWVSQADRQEGCREVKPLAANAALASAEREEFARLRRENKQLRLERDILSRAAAWFARETGAVPSPVSFADIPPGDRKRWSSGS